MSLCLASASLSLSLSLSPAQLQPPSELLPSARHVRVRRVVLATKFLVGLALILSSPLICLTCERNPFL